jgi:ribosome-binding protein aMBF1 (putative translation factor)
LTTTDDDPIPTPKQPGKYLGVPIHDDFLEIIADELKRTGIPKSHYAKWLGISFPALHMVMSGRTGVSIEKMDRMGRALGLRLRLKAERTHLEPPVVTEERPPAS